MSARLRGVVAALALLGAPAAAGAHGFAPGYLELRERADGRVEVLLKVPLGGEGGVEGRESIDVRLPRACREVARRTSVGVASAVLERYAVDCGPRGLGGATVALGGSQERGLDVLVHVRFASGRRYTGVLRADAPSLRLPASAGASAWGVARAHLGLGARHIAAGADHLLFVLGLVLLARGVGPLVRTVTAFTVGHSATLALAVLGVARVPQAPVEAVIAASILLLAVELTAPADAPPSWTRRAPWAVAAGFGLLHGFGFAGALTEAGLPPGNVPLALLFFNVGVELGQLAFVAFVLAALAAVRRFGRGRTDAARTLLAYGMGTAAVWWFLARTAAIAGYLEP